MRPASEAFDQIDVNTFLEARFVAQFGITFGLQLCLDLNLSPKGNPMKEPNRFSLDT